MSKFVKKGFTDFQTVLWPYSPLYELSVILSLFDRKDISGSLAGLDMFHTPNGTEDTARFLSGVSSSQSIPDTPNVLLPPLHHFQVYRR